MNSRENKGSPWKCCLCYNLFLFAQDLVDPSQYLALFPAAFQSQRSNFDFGAITALYNAIDFIGALARACSNVVFVLSSVFVPIVLAGRRR